MKNLSTQKSKTNGLNTKRMKSKLLKISIFTNNKEHHDYEKKKKTEIQNDVKQMIKRYYNLGTTGALNIIYSLRDDKIDQELIPTQKQIYNYLSELRRDLFGKSGMTFSELKNWCQTNIYKLFLTEHDGSVLNYEVSITEKNFRVVLSTNRLLENAKKRDLLVVDATISFDESWHYRLTKTFSSYCYCNLCN
ncbi:hypothetical protein BpHYR1_033899 [Brachionus plicatilis]|uniref:Uncharacterized protein n=1 Tax=Brachionus plicatilis TaxID=10195 RepID=A0A3M7PP19_BRAPC|nr:hypothetical protein BpHYR1_033899 [Brachionus plicatilis]